MRVRGRFRILKRNLAGSIRDTRHTLRERLCVLQGGHTWIWHTMGSRNYMARCERCGLAILYVDTSHEWTVTRDIDADLARIRERRSV